MLGIIVLNFNNPNETINCINSIHISSLIKYKIYIVDNSEDLNSFSQLNRMYKSNSNIKIIKSENNGYSAGNNLGIKMAIKEFCDLLLIVNPDVEFYKNTTLIYTWPIRNKRTAWTALNSGFFTVSQGDRISVFFRNAGSLPKDISCEIIVSTSSLTDGSGGTASGV